jgi:hypothetical protein
MLLCKQTPGPPLPCVHQMIQAHWALLPHRYPQLATQGKEWTPGSRPCYSAGSRRLPSPQRPSLPTALTVREPSRPPPTPVKEGECQIFHWGKESYNLLFYRWHQKSCSPKTQKLSTSTAPSCKAVMSLLSKSWNPSSSTKWQSTTLLVLGGLTPTVHRDPALPTVTTEEPLHPHQKAATPAPSLRGEKK